MLYHELAKSIYLYLLEKSLSGTKTVSLHRIVWHFEDWETHHVIIAIKYLEKHKVVWETEDHANLGLVG